MFDIPNWSMVKNPYYKLDRGSDELVITVGDSWTYGDSLGKTKVRNGIDDTEYRLAHVYGRLISDRKQTNWINLALPGASNEMVLDWLTKLLASNLITERQVTCVITLTEAGRHLENLLPSAQETSQQQALIAILKHTYNRIQLLKEKYPTINFLTAHNFTDGLDGYGLLDKTWLEVLLNYQIQNGTFIVISEHIDQMNYTTTYKDKLEIIEKALARIELLDHCEYCNKEDSRHPTEQGHMLWADYLISQIWKPLL